MKNHIFLLGSLSMLLFANQGLANVVVKCPSASSITVTKNTDKDPYHKSSPYAWSGPYSKVFGNSGSAPQNGNKVNSEAFKAMVENMGPWTDYFCIYKSNATTSRMKELPPMSGYIFYQTMGSSANCKAKGTEFICS